MENKTANTTKNPTLEKVQEIFRKYKGNPALNINMDSKFSDFELDSLDAVDLAMTIEDEMDVKIAMSAEIQKIGHIVNIIDSQKVQG